ncbi:MAG: prepilin-type N-terminal cleavage/methylation domain-containing protein [Clostridiales bacterium]|nr:prepilin-type N-terminal cleavage/methylation domain-containing protein [Clostridiales bacterium]
MRKINSGRRSKKALTLVELIVAMTLTAIFAASCVLLIAPVMKIYKHANDMSRAQLVADSVVDEIRAECSKAIVAGKGDVWIMDLEGYNGTVMPAEAVMPSDDGGNVLIFRRNKTYCETIASSYIIQGSLYNATTNDFEPIDIAVIENDVTSRSIYDMSESDKEAGLVHFGYFLQNFTPEDSDGYSYVYPAEYYDFTNPFSYVSYLGYRVDLNFHNLTYDGDKPEYVICDVQIKNDSGIVYTRSAVLSFP